MATIPSSRRLLRAGLAILLSAVSLFLAFQQVSVESILEASLHTDAFWVAATIAGMLFAHFCRAMRWRVMLRSLGPVRVSSAFNAVMIAYGLNQILPRGGELARPFILGRREHLSKSSLLATVVIERVIDLLSLGLSLLVAMWISTPSVFDALGAITSRAPLGGMHTSDSLGSILIRASAPILASILLLAWLCLTHSGVRVLEWLAHRGPARYHATLERLFGRFRDGLRVVRSSGQVEWMTIWTIGIWIGYGLATWFPIHALHLERYGLTFGDAFALMAIITVGRTIAPTPGAIGVYHFFCIQALVLLYHVSPTDAAAFATVSHGVQYAAMILIGAGLWMVEQVRP